MTHTKEDIRFNTSISKQFADAYIKQTNDFLKDSDRNRRLNQEFECQTCFYLRHNEIAGQSFSGWNCRVCNQAQTWGNTNTPKICNDCAKRFQLCKKCGGEVDPKLNYPPLSGDI